MYIEQKNATKGVGDYWSFLVLGGCITILMSFDFLLFSHYMEVPNLGDKTIGDVLAEQ